MNTIYKYPIKLSTHQTVEMPKGSRILSVADQNGTICIWAQVTREETIMESRTIEIAGTGDVYPTNDSATRCFLGTVVIDPFVYHVFEKLPE